MIRKELKKMNRRELVDIIYQMKKNEQLLQKKNTDLQEALNDKRIRLSEAGSIAEAAASITNLFSAAQSTADVYLQEIACLKKETEQECAKMIENARETAGKMVADSEKQVAELEERYQTMYEKLRMIRRKIRTLEKSGAGED